MGGETPSTITGSSNERSFALATSTADIGWTQRKVRLWSTDLFKHKSIIINDFMTLEGRKGQGFCDDISQLFVMKAVKRRESFTKYYKLCRKVTLLIVGLQP